MNTPTPNMAKISPTSKWHYQDMKDYVACLAYPVFHEMEQEVALVDFSRHTHGPVCKTCKKVMKRTLQNAYKAIERLDSLVKEMEDDDDK